MLAEYLSKYKAGLSLTFAIIFSISNLIIHSNFIGISANRAASVLDFFTGAFHSFGQGIVQIVDSYGKANELKEERDALRKKLQESQFLQFQTELLEKENQRLREILELPERKGFGMVAAEVISIDPDNWFRTIIINKGSEDGVDVYMPVMAYQVIHVTNENGEVEEKLVHGIIGKVIQVTAHSARILPITDQHSRLGIKVKKSGHWGMLMGQSQYNKAPRLDYIALNIELQEGDEIVTSGAGGVFPPNINVGVIMGPITRGATFQEAYLKPSIDIRKLNIVLVVQKTPTRRKRLRKSLSSDTVQKDLIHKLPQSNEPVSEPASQPRGVAPKKKTDTQANNP